MPDPGPILVEQRLDEGDPEKVWARRVTEAGEVHVLTNVGARFVDGKWEFTRAEQPSWRHEATLPADALRGLREVIAGSGFFDLDAEIEPPVNVIHGADEEWDVRLDGREHTVRVLGLPENHVPAVAAIAEAIESGLGAADAAS